MGEITLKPLSGDKLIVHVPLNRESVSLMDMVEDGIEDYEQFFVKVNLPFLRQGVNINRFVILDNNLTLGDCL